ncbi:uncharacterized protein LOC105196746 isoform X2 [Solenopsis invicta]|uniref:uncharacterized protein LOC105196746 isoform X2 n=1 Tax=Solenopsis invicta TaxID=13686 RepID=UPI00193DBE02|nr:uncharacterized protein LOC105196746 isoform X2 [Solenopsis invicta]
MQRQNHFSIIIFLVMALSILHSSKALKCYASSFDELTMEKIEDREMERMECPPTKPLCVKFSSSQYLKSVC